MQLVSGSRFVLQQQCRSNSACTNGSVRSASRKGEGTCSGLALQFCAQLRQQGTAGASTLLLRSRQELASTSRLVNGWSTVGQTLVKHGSEAAGTPLVALDVASSAEC